jgi:hypothetical protein
MKKPSVRTVMLNQGKQRYYRQVYHKTPPSVNSIKNWYEKFLKTGSVEYHLMLTDDLNIYYPKHCQSSRICHTSI